MIISPVIMSAVSRSIILILCSALFSSCAISLNLDSKTEYVLTNGMVITAKTKFGIVKIFGELGNKRTYEGDGWRKSRHLIERDKRWNGSLGLYDPAASFYQSGRLLLDEGRLFFDSELAVLKHFYVGYPEGHQKSLIYNNSGLFIKYNIVEFDPDSEPVRTVNIYQVYINGMKPKSLKGARDALITITGGEIPDTAVPYPAPVGYELQEGSEFKF
jgi:hypothetical protein